MKPFLILHHRPEEETHQQELEAIVQFGNLSSLDVVSIRIDREHIPEIDFSLYSGIIIGGGPWNTYLPDDQKSSEQRKAESSLIPLLHRVVEEDMPLFGICYGMEILVVCTGGRQTHDRYSESAGAVDIELTELGTQDPLLKGLPETFRAFVGHKEACDRLPPDAVWLAKSQQCPYEMIRMKSNIYATQFHPELETEGFCLRTEVYKHAGYFLPEEFEMVQAAAKQEHITVPLEILRRFIQRYSRT